MKKSLLGLLLAVAMVVPAFAVEKGDMAVDAKVGVGFTNLVSIDNMHGVKISYDFETPYSLSADFYYGIMDQLAIGVGVSHTFYTKLVVEPDGKFALTNVYFAVKPELKADSKIFSSLYAIGQIGCGFLSQDLPDGASLDNKNSLYVGFGVGTELVYGIILEIIYSLNSTECKPAPSGPYITTNYRAVTLNIGYKFAL